MVGFIAYKKAAIIQGTLATKLHIPFKAVAGAKTSKQGGTNDISKTVEATVANLEKQVMQIKIGDIAKSASQVGKLAGELNKQKDSLLKQVQAKE